MLTLYRPKAEAYLGLDVSSSSVKLLELSQSDHTYQVESFGVLPSPPGVVVEKVIKDIPALAKVIQQLVNKAHAKAKYAVIAVPDSSVITKIVQVDNELDETDIENQVVIEAEKYIPFPLQEVSMDFAVLGPSSKSPRLLDILVAATRSEHVNARVEVLAEAGLTAKIIDVESYAIERAIVLLKHQLPEEGKDKVIAVVDFGATVTGITILDNFKTVYSTEEVFGGQQLTESIQKHYGLSPAEAGLAKKLGNLPDDYELQVLAPFREATALQLKRALEFFFSTSQYTEVHHIILAGGAAKVAGLVELIEKRIEISTSLANPFQDMKISAKVDKVALTNEAPSLLVCAGLAMRSFNHA